MGYFSQIAVDVEEALFEGATVEQIAQRFNISEEQVEEYITQLEDADREPDHGELVEWMDFDPDC